MLSTDFSTYSKHRFLITLGNTSAKIKGLECTIAYITSKAGFQTMSFYINQLCYHFHLSIYYNFIYIIYSYQEYGYK